MRHFCQVGNYEATLDIFTNTDGEWMLAGSRIRRSKHITQGHYLAVDVRYLDTDCRFTRDRCEDANLVAGNRVGDVVAQAGHGLDLYAGGQFNLVAGHRWAAHQPGYLGVDTKFGKYALNRGYGLIVGRCSALWRSARRK